VIGIPGAVAATVVGTTVVVSIQHPGIPAIYFAHLLVLTEVVVGPFIAPLPATILFLARHLFIEQE